MHCFPSCHLPVPSQSLVITNQGWPYKFSPFMGHSFETGTFPGELLTVGTPGQKCQQVQRERGLGPVGSLRNSQCLCHRSSPGLIPTPKSYMECRSLRPPAPWNSLHFSLWTSHHTCSGFMGRRNCYREAEPALSPPCSHMGGWSPGRKHSSWHGPEALLVPIKDQREGARSPYPLHLLKCEWF